MPDETINGKLTVNGQADVTQVTVKGHSAQTNPLQEWQDNLGNTLSQVAEDGRFQVGDFTVSAPDALLEANAELVAADQDVKRGLQSVGQITGSITSAITWAMHELQLLGSGGVSAVQTALQALVTLNNSGETIEADARAGDFEAINQAGTVSEPTGQLTGLRGVARNEDGAYATDVIGLEVNVAKGTTGSLEQIVGVDILDLPEAEVERYAIHTGDGPIRFGDYLEMVEQETPPAAPQSGSGVVRIYPKTTGQLFALDDAGIEHNLTDQASGGIIATHDTTVPSILGYLHFVTDSPLNQMYDGQNWQGLYEERVTTLPPTSGWLWVNQGSATLSEKGDITIAMPQVSGSAFRLRMRTMPAAPYTLTGLVRTAAQKSSQVQGGLILRDSNSERLVVFVLDTNYRLEVAQWNNAASWNADVASTNLVQGCAHHGLWLKIEDDNTNHVFSYSLDGFNFITVYTMSRTAWLAAPDEIGFGLNSNNLIASCSLLHWNES